MIDTLMPIHDYKCQACSHVSEDLLTSSDGDFKVCPECGSFMTRMVCAPRPVLFREGWFEHISEKPIYVKSRKQLKAECKEHNCTSDYAEL